MCRAIRVVAVAPDADAAAALRHAVGAEAEVVDVVSDRASAPSAGGPFDVDVVVVDARTPDALDIMRVMTMERPRIGVVWVGDEPPPDAHASASIGDDLSGTIVRALIARRT